MEKVAFVIHRYGKEIAGGSESLCRQLATRLKNKFQIEIITTCAKDYVTWENHYPEGSKLKDGILIHRFKVDYPRGKKFHQLHHLLLKNQLHSKEEELEWLKAQGPYSSGLFDFLQSNNTRYDLHVFFTYLYCTTYFGLQLINGKSILIPTAHDERPIYMSIFDEEFQRPDAIIFLSPEEKDFALKRFGVIKPWHHVVGVGLEPSISHLEFPLFSTLKPYIVHMGRISRGKNCHELIDFFIKYKKEKPEINLKLVIIGDKQMELPQREDIVFLGYVDEPKKQYLLQNAVTYIQPSLLESFSLAIFEAWQSKTPVIVNGKNKVTAGHCQRSQGGFCYHNYQEFVKALTSLLTSQSLNRNLALNGFNYVTNNYHWPVIEKKYYDIFTQVCKDSEG